ncbi:MAG: hypothetical protein ACD_39C01639G0003 [uncultured bacterium]|nr:MAG: hypothetical protein ACD_39C01639G0003 [uncultured bacterium]
MIHPDTELTYINPVIGHGLVATRTIPKGTITWARDPLDIVFEPDAYNTINGRRKEFLYKYCFIDGEGQRILCWDHGRFVNHSCQPTCIAPGFEFEVAVRDILPGEQLTCDYALLNIDEDFECSCGAPDCRKVIHPADPEIHHKEWDAQVRNVFSHIDKLPQPLWEFVIEKNEIKAAISNPSTIPSCLKHYYRGPR